MTKAASDSKVVGPLIGISAADKFSISDQVPSVVDLRRLYRAALTYTLDCPLTRTCVRRTSARSHLLEPRLRH